jgi:hypothetical protein
VTGARFALEEVAGMVARRAESRDARINARRLPHLAFFEARRVDVAHHVPEFAQLEKILGERRRDDGWPRRVVEGPRASCDELLVPVLACDGNAVDAPGDEGEHAFDDREACATRWARPASRSSRS